MGCQADVWPLMVHYLPVQTNHGGSLHKNVSGRVSIILVFLATVFGLISYFEKVRKGLLSLPPHIHVWDGFLISAKLKHFIISKPQVDRTTRRIYIFIFIAAP